MPIGGGSGEGGFAQRGYGGVAQPGGNVSSGVGGQGGGGGGSGSNSGVSQSQNYVGPPRRQNFHSAYSGSQGWQPGAGHLVINNPFGAWDYTPEHMDMIYGNVNLNAPPKHNGIASQGFFRDPAYGKGGSPGAGGSNSGQGGMGSGGWGFGGSGLGLLGLLNQMRRRHKRIGSEGHGIKVG